ncbi:uncharacterized protein LOC111832443 [Capsella rubella]|uniref:uncharacterized protein LOC111832443 n=1 Tax=Capsella rubella TaxID=81985 RepID=UPI000CD4EBC5|nr:uncharacterized protein LOC111832443 [Capsella rubella]
MAGKGKSTRGRGGKSAAGVRVFHGESSRGRKGATIVQVQNVESSRGSREARGVRISSGEHSLGGEEARGVRISSGEPSRGRRSGIGASSHSSVARSESQSVTQSNRQLPTQYPARVQPPSRIPQRAPHAPQPVLEEDDEEEDENDENHDLSPAEEENPEEEENPNDEDSQALLNRLLALPGRQHLPLLSKDPIPGVETLWFNRHRGILSRAIAGIFRRKFDGPYYSWKVTPPSIRERYFRTFARKFNWDSDITELVRDGFLVIAKKW